MKDVGKAAVAVTLLCFFTQIGHLLGERRQNAIHEFRTYHKTRPVLYTGRHKRSTTRTQSGHLPDATVVLTTFNQVLTLDLVLNRHLLPANYTEKYFRPDGSVVYNRPKNHTLTNCYYHGDVRNSTDSAVAVSTCNGLSGYIRHGVEVFYIEPADGSLTGEHYVYRATDRISSNKTDILDYVAVSPTLGKIQIKSSRKKRSIHWPYDRDSNTRIVELYIVNDHEQYVNSDRDVGKTIRRTKDIINIVSSLYRAADIYVALVGIEIWTRKNLIEVVDDATDTMNNFLEYRRTSICPKHRQDNSQMISGHTFLNGVVGKATIGGICTFQYSGGVDMDHSSLAVVAGTTLTHEMGHNFGLKHDLNGCDCPLRRCIMSPSSGGAEAVTWSSCSTEQFADAFHQGFDYCLRNVPDELYGDAYCGNGFLEEGEECDCGLTQDCDTKCCDPTTCKLTVNATCATGECCDLSTCQLKPVTTQCRSAKNSCDLPEFCDGKVEFCPSDVFLQNGVTCKNDVSEAYCYEGKCRSQGSQCRLLWGKTGGKSHDQCYTRFNTHGESYGNCGFNWTDKSFKKCAKKDVMCGTLHCTHRNEKLMFWSGQMSYTLPSNVVVSPDGEKFRCESAILDVGLDMPDPGLVPNGAKCGDDKLCFNQECVPVTSLQHTVCPDCHGHGVCNSLGQCHCEVGYAPPDCAHSGDGGSLHSGPIKIYSSSRGLLVGLLVFFLLILPLLAVAIFCGYRHRGHLKKFWREGAPRHYRSVCRNVPSGSSIWKRSTKRTPSPRQPAMELGRATSFRGQDISNPRNLNSTNKTVGHVTHGGHHMTSGAHSYDYANTDQVNAGACDAGYYGNSSHDDKPMPTRPAPTRPAPAIPVQRYPVPAVPPQPLASAGPPPRLTEGPQPNDWDHEYVNKPRPARPPPPQQPPSVNPQQHGRPTPASSRQPVPSPRTQTPGNQWPPSQGCDSATVTEEGESEAERRERFQQTRNAFQSQHPAPNKPTVPAKPTVGRSESTTSRTGVTRPLVKPPPPPQSTKPTFNK